jgi:hypothetical protein
MQIAKGSGLEDWCHWRMTSLTIQYRYRCTIFTLLFRIDNL